MEIDVVISIGHFAGALLVHFLLLRFILYLADLEEELNGKNRLSSFAIKLRVSVEDIDQEEMQSKVSEAIEELYSDELLKNRLSDLCDIIITIFSFSSALLQIGGVFYVVWICVTENFGFAVWVWSINVIWVFCRATGNTFSYMCKIITGIYPGEAKKMRKMVAEQHEIRKIRRYFPSE